MKQWMMKNTFFKALGIFIGLSILILGVSIYFIYDNLWIGPSYVALALLGIVIAKFCGVELKSIYADIMFGVIDNGILIFTTILGGKFAGVAGAVLGGAAGNTITDGVGGLIEGKIAAKLKHDNYEEEKNSFTTMIGKIIGCLLGAGIALMLVWFVNLFALSFFE